MVLKSSTVRPLLLLLVPGLLAGLLSIACSAPQQSAPGTSSNAKNSSEMPLDTLHPDAPFEYATLAGGCFWCVEAIYQDLKGVVKVESGYTGGSMVDPSYQAVCTGTTGHAEAVRITFDPKVISYHDLLEIFFTVHDPTTLNRQGYDSGTQYRSAIFYHSEAQRQTAETVKKEAQEIWDDPIVTEITPASAFYVAEKYHQNYYKDNPYQAYCTAVISPKVKKFREKYRDKLKQ